MDFIEKQSENSSETHSSNAGKVLLGITGGIAVGITLISASFLAPALRKYCLPYIPATDTQIRNILTALKGRSGNLLDIGSGDGRIVLETAKLDLKYCHGVELNFWLVLYSKISAFKRQMGHKTKFCKADLWKFNMSEYDNIIIFGVEQMMGRLEKKLEHECKAGCRILACRFPLPNKTPQFTVGNGVDTVWVYSLNKE